jgi:tetratricopeptide (TPR) repeat protein
MSTPLRTDLDAAIRQAIALHQAGNLAAAASLYRELLRDFPDRPQLLHLLATAELQQGNDAASVALCSRALAVMPDHPELLVNIAIGLRNLGRLDEALAQAERAVAAGPQLAATHENLGNILQELKRYAEALKAYGRAVALAPGQADIYCNRGRTLMMLRRLEEAQADYRHAIACNPNHAEAYNGLSCTLRELQRLEDSLAAAERAIALDPTSASGHNNRGNALRELQRYDEALKAFDRAIQLAPQDAGAYSNRCNALTSLGRLEDAIASCEQALRLDSNLAEANWNLATYRLLQGDFATGWTRFEWRWQGSNLKGSERHYSQPRWSGAEPLAGKTILLHAEQGLGDTLQFCRYAPMVAAMGAHVELEVQKPLLSLLATLPDDISLMTEGDALPDFDYHCPLMSLPLAFGTMLETIPAAVPYLAADPIKRAAWRKKLGEKTALRIGLAWSGKRRFISDLIRNIPLSVLAPLRDLPCEFHCLQKEIWPEDAARLTEFPQVRIHRTAIDDFSDTAALAAEMDLIVTVDTSVAHMAGSIGKPVWILLPYLPDWRWLLNRSDSPWYPNATLIRQPRPGDWSSVIAEIVARLETFGAA